LSELSSTVKLDEKEKGDRREGNGNGGGGGVGAKIRKRGDRDKGGGDPNLVVTGWRTEGVKRKKKDRRGKRQAKTSR